MQGVIVVDHPLVQHKLTVLRDRTTSTKTFRQISREVARPGTHRPDRPERDR